MAHKTDSAIPLPYIEGKMQQMTLKREKSLMTDKRYSMTRYPRGLCVIINNKHFVDGGVRKGTDQDVLALEVTFEERGFITNTYNDLTDTQILHQLTKISHRVDHSKYDCFVCCILSHGGKDTIEGTNGGLLDISKIISIFYANACPGLKEKPKLFFLQTCRGEQRVGASFSSDRTQSGTSIANNSDVLLGYATQDGCVSYRNEITGSFYMQTLCDVLQEYSEQENLLNMLTTVNKRIASMPAYVEGENVYQVPYPAFSLRKHVYLQRTHLVRQIHLERQMANTLKNFSGKCMFFKCASMTKATLSDLVTRLGGDVKLQRYGQQLRDILLAVGSYTSKQPMDVRLDAEVRILIGGDDVINITSGHMFHKFTAMTNLEGVPDVLKEDHPNYLGEITNEEISKINVGKVIKLYCGENCIFARKLECELREIITYIPNVDSTVWKNAEMRVLVDGLTALMIRSGKGENRFMATDKANGTALVMNVCA